MTRTSLLLSFLLATTAAAQATYFTASLDGAQEVPPVTTSARGWGIVRFDTASNQVRIFLHTDGLVNATAAHLHAGPVGINGGVLVPLSSSNGSDWTGSGTLSAANAALLLAGDTYLNAHTPVNPGGEIRGQVVLPTATRMTAILDGAQEVPPNGSTATGVGIAFLHEPDDRIVYTVRTQGLVNVTAAHFHVGAAGVAGPVLEALNGGPTDYCGVTRRLTASEVAAAKADGLYFNVHTTTFPGGEIRGQIRVNVGDFRAVLSGANEVPPVVTNAFGSGCLTVNPDATVTYEVSTSGLVGTAGHIHRAPIGLNGSVIVPFAGGPTVFSGTSSAQTAAALTDARSGLWYVNVHTAANPGGEIRGQVEAARLPTPFGGACANSNGGRSQIGSSGFPCLGATFEVTLSGGAATAPAVFTLGANRDTALGLPLPLELGLVGAPTCFLFHDLAVSVVLATDATGCARFPLGVPLVPTLRGGHLYAQWFLLDQGLRASNALDMQLQ
ncbi:MAG: CHRD domain-containing protein [Planctomycetota bacterium]